jgi:hypothetical protein
MAIAGSYTVEIETPMGSMTGKLTLTVDNNSIRGICSTRMGDQPITGTLISDHEITFSTRLNLIGQINVTGIGRLNGDEISGYVTAGSFGSFPFKGVKE